MLVSAIVNDESGNNAPLSKEVFQFNHKDSLEEVTKRFEPWLLKSLSAGLRMWKENL